MYFRGEYWFLSNFYSYRLRDMEYPSITYRSVEAAFQAAKAMMLQFPNYNNDVISVECGFSSRTQLYRIFKIKEGCTPTVWRENNGTHTF